MRLYFRQRKLADLTQSYLDWIDKIFEKYIEVVVADADRAPLNAEVAKKETVFIMNLEDMRIGIYCKTCRGIGIKEEVILENKHGPVNTLMNKCEKCEDGTVWIS